MSTAKRTSQGVEKERGAAHQAGRVLAELTGVAAVRE